MGVKDGGMIAMGNGGNSAMNSNAIAMGNNNDNKG
jgi:hypothetical protein